MNTRQLFTNRILRALVGVGVALSCSPALHAAEAKTDLAALVESMPKCDRDGKHTGPAPEVALKAVQQILAGGKEQVLALAGMLREPGKGEDYKAHYLLHAVATHARRPGAEAERKLVCDALAAALRGAAPEIVRAHILEELLWLGGTESVDAVSKLLLDARLYDFAIRALQIRKAAEPLRAALPAAKGRNRVAIIQALGRIRDAEAVPALIEAVGQSDAPVRLAAIEALGDIGDPRAVGPILDVAKLERATYEEMKTAEAALRLAQRLLDADKKDDAKRIYTTLAKRCPGTAGRHIRAGCLQGLAAVAGDEIMTELLSALADPDPQVRAVAARTAASLPGGKAVQKWLDLLKKAPPKDHAGILFVLGAIGDAKALPAMLDAMDSQDQTIRLEAMRSVAAIGTDEAVRALVARAVGKEGDEQQTALDSLIKSRGPSASALVGAAVKKASEPAVRARLVDVLAARRATDQLEVIAAAAQDADASVRLAAMRALKAIGGSREMAVLVTMLKSAQKPSEREAAEQALLAIARRARDQVAAAVIPAIQGANADAAAALFRILATAGGSRAAKALTACAKDPDPKIRDEAVRALSNWRERQGMAEAHDGLLKVAKETEDPRHLAMALRQYISLARQRWRRDPRRQVKACEEALKLAKRPEERRLVLGMLGEIQTTESLKLAASCLEDKDVAEDAAAAVVRIVRRLGHKTDPNVQAALRQVVSVSENKRTVSEAKRFLVKEP